MNDTIISPSILSANFLSLEDDITSFDKANNIWFHLDIMDGHFVPNFTFGPTVVKNLQKITKHKLDAHFMVTNPELHAEMFSKLGIHNFTFHWEAVDSPEVFIKELKRIYPSVGISIKPGTDVDNLSDSILSVIDLVLVMTVEPGFGGQSFMNKCVSKIEALADIKRKKGYSYIIQVDGGVNDKTAKICINAGANNLVAGSYIFNRKQDHYLVAIDSLRSQK